MVKRNVIMIEIYRIHLRDSGSQKTVYPSNNKQNLRCLYCTEIFDWTLINHLLYKKNISRRLPLLVDGSFVSHSNKKANLFNNFLSIICTPMKNASTLSYFFYRRNNRMSFFHATEKDI